MYRTIKLEIGKDLQFDAEFEGLWVKVIPVVYLSLEAQTLITEIFSNGRVLQAKILDDTTPVAEMAEANVTAINDTIQLLAMVVADWNLQTHDGTPLPVPSKIDPDELLATIKHNIPQIVLTYIVQKVMEETGEIPPARASESQKPFGKPTILQDPKLEDSLATHSGETPVPLESVLTS